MIKRISAKLTIYFTKLLVNAFYLVMNEELSRIKIAINQIRTDICHYSSELLQDRERIKGLQNDISALAIAITLIGVKIGINKDVLWNNPPMDEGGGIYRLRGPFNTSDCLEAIKRLKDNK